MAKEKCTPPSSRLAGVPFPRSEQDPPDRALREADETAKPSAAAQRSGSSSVPASGDEFPRPSLLNYLPFPLGRFHVLLNSLFKVLFNFPSRYLFAIGLVVVFSLRWSLPPA